jgi:hypothetical protein
MPFVRGKTRRTDYDHDWRYIPPYTRTFYYLVENYREGRKVRQHTLAYLGKYPSVGEALAGLQNEIERAYENAKVEEDIARGHGWLPPDPRAKCRWREHAQELESRLTKLQGVVTTLSATGC